MERMRTVKNMGVNEAMSDGKRQDKADSRERKKKVHPDCLLVPAANNRLCSHYSTKKTRLPWRDVYSLGYGLLHLLVPAGRRAGTAALFDTCVLYASLSSLSVDCRHSGHRKVR